MSIELGSLATATKSAGVRVIPMDSMRADSRDHQRSIVARAMDGRRQLELGNDATTRIPPLRCDSTSYRRCLCSM